MSAVEKKHPWNVFDGVKIVAVDPPEVLMAEINSAIASLEYARAPVFSNKSSAYSEFDARMADEAYKAGMASMAAGNVDEAVISLNVALSKCPPHKTFAVAKLQSLISVTSQQLQKSPN
ncbi:hypothetical protein ABFS82_03G045500 [Erythranthe guttata]